MIKFSYYFTDSKVLHALAEKRIAVATKRHEAVFLNNILHPKSRQSELSKSKDLLIEMFPPRSAWIRLSKAKRLEYAKNPKRATIQELFYTVLKARKKAYKTGSTPAWLRRLENLILDIRKSMMEAANLTQVKPSGYNYILKNKATKEHRVTVVYDLKDNIISSLVTKYLTDHTDTISDRPYFSDNSYAFRSSRLSEKGGRALSYHLAAKDIEAYRQRNTGKEIYVAEIDLAKFFDTINHTFILECLDKMVAHFYSLGKPLDLRGLQIARSYLDSFSFNIDALPNEIDGKRNFKWPDEKLRLLGVDIDKERIGVAQGGALSCFFANLIMHELDLLFQADDADLAYLRYCDDFIILHTDRRKCKEYLDRALGKIRELKLVAHSPDDYELSDYKKKIRNGNKEVNEFWNSSKSKNPYKWGPYDAEHRMNVPYVSFVGYQRKYNGLLRVRKKSMQKEYDKQRELVDAVIERIRLCKDGEIKLNRKQIIFRTEQKLIAMSVGKKNIRNVDKTLGFCWCGGFKEMGSSEGKSNGQLKHLDRSRERQLSRLRKELKKISFERIPREAQKVKKLYKPLTSYYAYFNNSGNKKALTKESPSPKSKPN
jgi:hypothetical protein